jgi:AcrR family transcriptional regulator
VSEPAHRFGPFSPLQSPERARIRLALIDAALRDGLPSVTVEQICREAGVERATFERDFAGVADCAIQVYKANIAEFDRIVFVAVERQRGWPPRLRAAAYAALSYVAERPGEARFNFVSMLEAGDAMQLPRDRYVRRVVALIDEGRAVAPDPGSIPPGTAEAAFGSVYQFILTKVVEDPDALAHARDFVPELMYVAVRPYLGHEAALRELEIPPPPDLGEER